MNRREREGAGSPGEGGPERDPLPGIPGLEGDPELQALDRELAGLRIEERPSLGPELERELGRRWRTRRRAPGRPPRRTLALAAGVVLLVTGVAVPPARAALVRLIQAVPLVSEPEPAPEPTPAAGRPPVTLSPVGGGEEETPEPRPDPLPVTAEAATSGGESLPRDEVTVRPSRSAPPEIWDRRAARALVSRFYPAELYEAGIGGVVGLLIYVDSDGNPAQFRVDRSSGIAGLDRAALVAAPRLRFLPARRNGESVGTWVEFDVRFDPDELRPAITGLLVVRPGEEIAPRALSSAMPLPAILPPPPAAGTVGILVKLRDLPESGETVEIGVELERAARPVRERIRVPFRLQGEEGFRTSWERPVERIGHGVLYATVDLSGVAPGRYEARVRVRVPARGEILEATAPVTVR